MINNFKGVYSFLSNFYNYPVTYNGLTYLNSEAAFQAQKVLDDTTRRTFCNLGPAQAKANGRRVFLRRDWEEVKDQIMYDIVYAKFTTDNFMKQSLINTGAHELIEGNTWNDTYWGVCKGRGHNNLGKILMLIRRNFVG